MNKIIFFLFIILFYSCEKNTAIRDFKNEIDSNDINCLKEISRAEKDLKEGIDVYCKSFGMLIDFDKERHSAEFDSILKSKNIKVKTAVYSDMILEDKRQNCYCEIMNLMFEEKYGTQYIDSIHFIADSLWILKNLDLTFAKESVYGSWDKPALFPGDKYYNAMYHSGLQDKFDSLFTYYDDDYIYTNKENGLGLAQIRVDIHVDKKGNATIKDYHITYFDTQSNKEDYNQKYYELIKNVAFKLITEYKWKPATIGNVDVNSDLSVFIGLK